MEKEQIDLIIRAAHVLQQKKEFYDYMIVILPVVTAFIGWFASIWWQSHTFNRSTKKEHYYVAREKVESIVESLNKLLEYVYTFHKGIKNDFNKLKPLDEDTFNDFVTEYQFRLSSIYQKLKIIFPGRRFSIEKFITAMKVLEANIIEMDAIIKAHFGQNVNTSVIYNRIEDINKKNSDTIDTVTKEISMIENAIIGILGDKAKDLGIRE